MKKYYNINYSLLALLLTMPVVRDEIVNHFIISCMKPLDSLHNDFIRYNESINTSINAQVCYMQARINDEFDFYERRIIIRNHPFDIDSLLTWHIATPKRTLIGASGSGDECLRNAPGQIGVNVPDFEVVFPAGFTLSPDEERRLRQLVNREKIATKKYIITNE